MLAMTMSGNWSMSWLVKPDTSLWFLWVLFWIGTLHVCMIRPIQKFKYGEEIVMAIASVLLLGVLLVSKLSFGFHLVAWYFPFYCMGYVTKKYWDKVY